jgi:hypothetical protein
LTASAELQGALQHSAGAATLADPVCDGRLGTPPRMPAGELSPPACSSCVFQFLAAPSETGCAILQIEVLSYQTLVLKSNETTHLRSGPAGNKRQTHTLPNRYWYETRTHNLTLQLNRQAFLKKCKSTQRLIISRVPASACLPKAPVHEFNPGCPLQGPSGDGILLPFPA